MTKIKRLVQNIFHGDFSKSVSMIASGHILGYAINTLTLPIISRVYTTKQLGEYDLIVSSATIYFSILVLGMITAIMLPSEDDDARNICKLLTVTTCLGATIALIILIIIEPGFHLFNISQNYFVACIFLWGYSICFNLQAIFFAFTNRLKQYKILFLQPIIYSGVNVVLSLLFGIFDLGALGYLLGTILGYVCSILIMYIYSNPLKGGVEWTSLKSTLIRYKSFPLIQMPSNFISTLCNQLPVQFFGRIYGTTVLGGYTMARKILSLPVSLLASPINNTYYRTAAEKMRRGEKVGEFAFHLIKTNIRIACIPVLILMIFGSFICKLILGDQWEVAGQYMSVIGVYYLISFCSTCISGTLILADKKPVSLISVIVKLVGDIFVFFVAVALELSFMRTLLLFTIVETLFEVIIIGLCLYYTGLRIRKYLRLIVFYVVLIYLIYAGTEIILQYLR